MKAHASDAIARFCKVFLDGVDVTNDCTFADEEAGTARLFVRDAAGHLSVSRVEQDILQVEKHGVVTIEVDSACPEGLR